MMWLELVSVLLHCRDSISTRFMSLQTSYTPWCLCYSRTMIIITMI